MLGIACPILHRAAFPEPVQDGRQSALAFHAAYLPCSSKPRFQNPQPTVQQPPKTIPASSFRTGSRHRHPDDSRSNTNCRSGKSTGSAFSRHAADSKPSIYTRYALARFPAAAPHRKLESALTAQINRSWPYQTISAGCADLLDCMAYSIGANVSSGAADGTSNGTSASDTSTNS